ncbi:TATA box-binding protein-associated factor RNA polymerase I subunit A [Danio aesculapii]|uniref:TATA box-binding protein-associated factor RNA polymerase I subunit A n=1 Tax=Danio aesculapii TaxID=1142201 RepID=UPI0024C002D6|nr:TATA box-binding protein-associated factor RNA polymerase I subunit A [Danio aesculapii]
MDDIEAELNIAETHADFTQDESEHRQRLKRPVQLHSPVKDRGIFTASYFLKCNRKCLKLLREAMLHHQWQEAVGYFNSYIQTLEAKTYHSYQSVVAEILWRLGIEILHHLPNASTEDFNGLYEQLKNVGVINFSKISLEHCYHLLLNGQMDEAKRQLSIAESWRYGKTSRSQSLSKTLITAYCGLLDYLIWSEKKSSVSENEELSSNHEMHSYFRQASVTLKDIISLPGIWDPFVLSYINMLEFYKQEESALEALENYAYNKEFPSNPNAHAYLYQFLKRHNAPEEKLISTLRILYSLVPSHELMLELCNLLLATLERSDTEEALTVCMDLLEFSSWKTDVRAWECLYRILKKIRQKKWQEMIQKEWKVRRSLWVPLHFRDFIGLKDWMDNHKLMMIIKKDCLRIINENMREYLRVAAIAEKEVLQQVRMKRKKKQHKIQMAITELMN